MAKTLRYTTFAPGELEARLRELSPKESSSFSVGTMERSANGKFLKSHSFDVTFPDGTKGLCCYERLGPKFHRFIYTYEDGSVLPHQLVWDTLPNDPVSLEQEGKSRTVACFQEAIEQERREYFCRASEPSDGSRKQRPEMFRMKAKTAKELAGHYCVCQVYAKSLFPRTLAYRSLEQAIATWKELDLPNMMIVACCNRLDRCWEVPKYNPQYADTELREVARTLSSERLGKDKEVLESEPLSGTTP